jgi:tryptophanyl-tRNA synthetase
METVFSGIQPSGELHLGNYVGAVQNWVRLQDKYRCIFCVVDLHAITQHYEPREMSARVEDMAIDLLALGIDPERSILFVQSMVHEHAELGWVFNTIAHMGELERMTQFKEKSEHDRGETNVGIFDYPVLQAADIMLYKAQWVPVGEDQRQHLELARDIVRRFNNHYGPTFPECEMLKTEVPKLLGLKDTRKMSKSLGNHLPMHATCDDKELWKLVGPAMTDPARAVRENPGNPDICNIFTMHKAISPPPDQAWVREGCTTAGIGCGDCKKKLTANMRSHFAAYCERRADLLAHPTRVREILVAGADKARAIARETMAEVRERLGLWHSH